MMEPHNCITQLRLHDVDQYLIGEIVGLNQSSISRIENRRFSKVDYKVVHKLQALYKHVCIEKSPVRSFKYEDPENN